MWAISSALLLLYLVQGVWTVYKFPNPAIRVYPKGFEASIAHQLGMECFYFQARRNSTVIDTWSGTVYQPNCKGRWVYKNFDAELKVGDSLSCGIGVTSRGVLHIRKLLYNISICDTHAGPMPSDPGTSVDKNMPNYEVPDPVVKFYAKGFKVSLLHEDGIEAVALKTPPVDPNDDTHWQQLTLTGELWTYENFDEILKLNDTLKYWISVTKNGLEYMSTKQLRHNADEVNGGAAITKLDEPLQNVIPLPYFRVYRQGFDVSITHKEGIEYFAFTAHRNPEIERPSREICSGLISKYDENGHWTYKNYDVQLNLGDTLNYTIAVIRKGTYVEKHCVFTVMNYESRDDSKANLLEQYLKMNQI